MGRAWASHQRLPQFSFHTVQLCPSESCSNLQVDKGCEARHVLQQNQGLVRWWLHIDVYTTLPQAAQAGLGHMVAVPHPQRAQRWAVLSQCPVGGAGRARAGEPVCPPPCSLGRLLLRPREGTWVGVLHSVPPMQLTSKGGTSSKTLPRAAKLLCISEKPEIQT